MSGLRTLLGAVGATAAVVSMTTAGVSTLAEASPRPAGTSLAGSVPAFTSHAKVLGDVAQAQPLTVQLWLRPDVAAAERFATAVSTPGGPLFHHYLSPAAYTARFAASRAVAGRVASWLRSQGFTGISTDAGRSYVRATATTAKVNAAFHVRMRRYQSSASVNAGPYALRANDRPISLPASLAGDVLGVTGLDNAAPLLPLQRSPGKTAAPASGCSRYYGQQKATGLPSHFGTTTFPTAICGYSGSQMRAAYRASSANTGSGQTIALVELGLTKNMFGTLKDYAARNHVPPPSPHRYAELSLGKNTCGDPFFIEEQLDVEMSYDMAPAAHQLVIGGDACSADFGLQGLFDADMTVLNGAGGHPLASIASNSWESGSESQEPSQTQVEHAFLVRAAAEGVGMYFSSGDASGVAAPSSDPFAIAVGGTTLGLGRNGGHLFETGWSTGLYLLSRNHSRWIFEGEDGAAGGGPSLLWKQPAYQKGVVPAALARAPGNRGGPVRSVPDVSADADPFTGVAVGFFLPRKGKPPKYIQQTFGGTSVAAPLVAGVVTAAQQGQRVSFGFLDPALYLLTGTSALFDPRPLGSRSPTAFRAVVCPAALCGTALLLPFDDQNPDMFGYTGQVTLPGYDNMTGVGTPDGPKFIAALRSLEG